MSEVARFFRQTRPQGECLLYTGARNHGGYGKFWLHGRTVGAHRFAFEMALGPIPEGLTIDHLCGIRHCVQPAHLEAVSIQENLRRAARRPENRQACISGHPFSEENTRLQATKRGTFRVCRTCERARSNAYNLRRRAAS